MKTNIVGFRGVQGIHYATVVSQEKGNVSIIFLRVLRLAPEVQRQDFFLGKIEPRQVFLAPSRCLTLGGAGGGARKVIFPQEVPPYGN